jgi:hypothetical protein
MKSLISTAGRKPKILPAVVFLYFRIQQAKIKPKTPTLIV